MTYLLHSPDGLDIHADRFERLDEAILAQRELTKQGRVVEVFKLERPAMTAEDAARPLVYAVALKDTVFITAAREYLVDQDIGARVALIANDGKRGLYPWKYFTRVERDQ